MLENLGRRDCAVLPSPSFYRVRNREGMECRLMKGVNSLFCPDLHTWVVPNSGVRDSHSGRAILGSEWPGSLQPQTIWLDTGRKSPLFFPSTHVSLQG